MRSVMSARGGIVTAVLISSLLATGISNPAMAEEPASSGEPSLADAASAPTETEAVAIASEFDHEVLVESSTTEYQQLFAQPDGTMMREISTLPERVLKAGGWVPVDTSLVEGASGMLEPRATTVPVRFSPGGTGPLVEVQSAEGQWLSEYWTLGVLPSPTIDGASATYKEVLPGVDLQLTAKATGMSEVLVIKSAAAASHPELDSLDLRIEGHSVEEQLGGSIGTIEQSDLRSSSPQWWDSSAEGSSADAPGGVGSTAPVDVVVNDDQLTLDVSSIAEEEAIEYPLYVDPDWTGLQLNAWFIDRAYPDQSYLNGGAYTDGVQKSGFIDSSWSGESVDHLARAYWQMDTSKIYGKDVIKAVFSVTGLYTSSCTATPVELWRVSGVPGATWNSALPSLSASWAAKVASASFVAGRSACPGTPTIGFTATPAVQMAADNSWAFLKLGLKAANESDSASWKRFSVGAKLYVTYNTTPNKPTSPVFTSPSRSCDTTKPSSVWVSNKAGITMRASFTDPDAGNVKGTFRVVQAASTSTVSYTGTTTLAAQGNQSHTMPASKLADGSYAWDAQTIDGYGAGSARTSLCYFEVRNSGPKHLPGIALSGTPTVGKPLTVTFTTDLNDGVDRLVYYVSPTALSAGFDLPVLSSPLPACGTSVGVAKVLCPDSAGKASVTYVPTDQISTVWVTSYDKVGNPAFMDGTTGAGKQLNSVADPGVTWTSGHGWLTGTMTSPLPQVLPDSNTTTPIALGLGAEVMRDVTANPRVADPTTGPQKPVLQFRTPVPYSSVHSGGADIRVSTAPAFVGAPEILRCAGARLAVATTTICDDASYGWATRENAGFLWPSAAAAGASAALVVSCETVDPLLADQFYLRVGTDCGADRFVEEVGYTQLQAEVAGSYSSGEAVDPSKSFTLSAWLEGGALTSSSTALSMISSTNVVQATLGTAASKWRFCIVPSGQSQVCAEAPRTTTGWRFVSGIWDAARGELRLYVGPNAAPVVKAAAAPADLSGVRVEVGAQAHGTQRWLGQISDVSVFPGVATATQRTSLSTNTAL